MERPDDVAVALGAFLRIFADMARRKCWMLEEEHEKLLALAQKLEQEGKK